MIHDSKAFLDLLGSISDSFFSQGGNTSLTRKILEVATRLTQGDRGSVFLAPTSRNAQNSTGSFDTLVATGLEGQEIEVKINEGVVGYVFKTNQAVKIDDAQNDIRFSSQTDEKTHYQTRTILCAPIRTPGGRTLGVLEILNSKHGTFTQDDLQILQILCLLAALALDQKDSQGKVTLLNERLIEAERNRIQLAETLRLRSSNRTLNEIYEKLPNFASSDSNILIEGESGTGKEVIATLLHLNSHRKKNSFVAVNCAAIPESLFEAELFGVAKGAATGTTERKGKFEIAHEGTLFLDEIGELPLLMQSKLLRVLQERTVSRVGSDKEPIHVNFRLIAATHHHLERLVQEGKFREDLFYRINVICIRVPPLRDRADDLPMLCESILKRFNEERGWKPKTLTAAALDSIKGYSWPGNIRQLQNKLEAAMVEGSNEKYIDAVDLKFQAGTMASPSSLSLSSSASAPIEWTPDTPSLDLKKNRRKLDEALIEKALHLSHGNKTQAAKLLGLSREGLRKARKGMSK